MIPGRHFCLIVCILHSFSSFIRLLRLAMERHFNCLHAMSLALRVVFVDALCNVTALARVQPILSVCLSP
jgi:hypothetical protein